MRHLRRSLAFAAITSILAIQVAIPAEAALPLRRKQCGAVVKTSFRLGNNLTCAKDGLIIGASGITIDLNGKTIRGDGGEDDNGIENIEGFDRVVIMTNLDKPRSKIVGFHDGIKIGSGTNRNTIRRVIVIRSVADGIDIDGGSGNRIVRVMVDGSGENGIEIAGNNAAVEATKVWGSGENGIEVVGGNATLKDVEVLVAAENGIDVRGSNSTLIRGYSGLVDLVGVRIEGDHNTVDRYRSHSNLVGGLHVIGSENDVAHSRANGNGSATDPDVPAPPERSFGILIQGDSNIVELNVAEITDGDGMVVEGILNTIRSNQVCGSTSGVQILDNGTDTFLEDNVTKAVCPER